MDRRLTLLLLLILSVLCHNVVECKKTNLIKLDEDTWSQILTGEWMVEL